MNMKNKYMNCHEMLNILKKLNNEMEKFDSIYSNLNTYFNNIKESEMEGLTNDTMIKICDKWQEINKKRLEEIKMINILLNNSQNKYQSVCNDIGKLLGSDYYG